VRRERGTSDLAETGDDVHDTRREASFLDECGSNETTKRGLFGGLQNDCVTASNSRANLPCPHEQREVPGNDLGAYTNGLLLDVVEGVGGGVNDLALDLVRPATVVPQSTDTHADVDLGHGDGLAIVERLNRGEQVEVLLEQIGELHKKSAAVLRGLFPPWAFESLACGGDGDVDVLLRGFLDRGDDALICGVDHIEGLAV